MFKESIMKLRIGSRVNRVNTEASTCFPFTRANNEATYYDGNNKLRSTQTNEQVHIRFMNGGYTKYIGLHSNTVYKNTLNKRNAELKGNEYSIVKAREKAIRHLGESIVSMRDLLDDLRAESGDKE